MTKGQMRMQLILFGFVLLAVGAVLLLPMVGISLPIQIGLPETVAGIQTLFIVGGVTALGLVIFLYAAINPGGTLY